MYLIECILFQADEKISHVYVWKGPDFVNMNSVISYQHALKLGTHSYSFFLYFQQELL